MYSEEGGGETSHFENAILHEILTLRLGFSAARRRTIYQHYWFIVFIFFSFFEKKLNSNQNSFQGQTIFFVMKTRLSDSILSENFYAYGGLIKFEKNWLNNRIFPKFFPTVAG